MNENVSSQFFVADLNEQMQMAAQITVVVHMECNPSEITKRTGSRWAPHQHYPKAFVILDSAKASGAPKLGPHHPQLQANKGIH